MALRWDFNKKVGEANFIRKFKNENEEWVTGKYTVSLYEGNAYMIFIYENDEDKTYSLYSFFVDKKHAEILLGLKKGNDGKKSNFFNVESEKMVTLNINKSMFSTPKKAEEFIGLIIKAFDDIRINLYTEEEVKEEVA